MNCDISVVPLLQYKFYMAAKMLWYLKYSGPKKEEGIISGNEVEWKKFVKFINIFPLKFCTLQ